MGTRCLTVFVDDHSEQEIAVLYRQFDGYPSGHGQDLKAILQGGHIGNGIPCPRPDFKFYNGIADLAVRTITMLKTADSEGDNPGNLYLHPAGTRDCGENYIYTITASAGIINLKVEEGDKTLYDGPVDDFDPEKAEE